MCGLKPLDYLNGVLPTASHPSWVCGLKHFHIQNQFAESDDQVTPFVGVWIETFFIVNIYMVTAGHTLRGCVD